LSSYLLYQNAMRSTFKQQNPNMTFGELAKFTSASYAAMSPEEKALWVEKALADKERYHNELAMYTPPPGKLIWFVYVSCCKFQFMMKFIKSKL